MLIWPGNTNAGDVEILKPLSPAETEEVMENVSDPVNFLFI